jgi:hypothetical protein
MPLGGHTGCPGQDKDMGMGIVVLQGRPTDGKMDTNERTVLIIRLGISPCDQRRNNSATESSRWCPGQLITSLPLSRWPTSSAAGFDSSTFALLHCMSDPQAATATLQS